MEAVIMVVVVSAIVFIFGLYADSSGILSEPRRNKTDPGIEYHMVSKKK
jgi:hypothetical protein